MINKNINTITDKRWTLRLKPIRKAPNNKELIRLLVRWQSNNSPNDLGIVRFGFELFESQLNPKYGVADWVRPALHEVLTFTPNMDKTDRAHAICTYREGSKSTWFAFVLPLYLILVGQYGIYYKNHLLPLADYIRMRGKNQDKAEEKLANITSEFSNNELLISLFGDLEPTFKEIKTRKLKNQAKLLLLTNDHILQAQGINQPSRGALIRGRRPKVDINDDVENKENTKTENQRQWNAKEILGEQYGGLDPHGLTIYIGNLVHKKCLLMNFLKSDPMSIFYRGKSELKTNESSSVLVNTEFRAWKTQYYQITEFDENGKEKPNWAKRLPLSYVRKLEKWYNAHPDIGGRKIFRMEYYNEIVSDKNITIRYADVKLITKLDPIENSKVNFIKVTSENGETKEIPAYIVVSGDPAISQAKQASDRAIVVTAFGADKKRYVLDMAVGKFDIRDRYYNKDEAYAKFGHLAITPEDMSYVHYRGMVEEMARKIIKWNANRFVLENAGQQLAWYNDLVVLLKLIGLGHIRGVPYRPKDEKIYKLESGLLNWWEADRYIISTSCPYSTLIADSISVFPEGNLDILDAMYNGEVVGQRHIPPMMRTSKVNSSMLIPSVIKNEFDIDEPYILV